MNIKQTYTVLLFIFLRMYSNAQQEIIHHPQIQFVFADSLYLRENAHVNVQPLEVSSKTYNTFFYQNNHSHNIFQRTSNNSIFLFHPVFECITDFSKLNNNVLGRIGQGVHVSNTFRQKIGFNATFSIYEQLFSNSLSDSIRKQSLIPGFSNYLLNKKNVFVYPSFNGFLFWKPFRYLTLKIGKDKQFWGDGHRSLFLSENADSYPFSQLNINVWKTNYIFQTLYMKDLVNNHGKHRYSKYISMHQLSYNVLPRLTIYVYEAVVWRSEDTLVYRRLDMNYMNPFLFFRPAEYNIGSPDNMLFGIGGRLRIFQKTHLYGQLLLDEFRFQELTSNRGWWGNKYGIQAGLKTYGLFSKKKSMFLVELNRVTPYTYSHSSSLENYGYLYRSLAHPQGSNFDEAIMVFRIATNNRNFVHFVTSGMRYGTNPPNLNYGGDIYQPQSSFVKAYGNTMAQGITHYDIATELQFSRILNPAWRLNAFISFTTITQKTNEKTNFSPGFSFGINTLLYE